VNTVTERQYNLLVLLPVGGVVSALASISLMGFQIPSPYFMGFIFGAIFGASLARAKIIGTEGWVLWVFAATVAHFVSFLIVFLFPTWMPAGAHSTEGVSRGSLVAAGLAGALLIVGVLQLIRQEYSVSGLLLKPLIATLAGGTLAALGWKLAPSVGTAFWRVLSSLGLSGRAYEPGDMIDYGPANVAYAVYFVWQVGMAIVIALLVWDYEPVSDAKEVRKS
jgi:hypothetical protein